MPKRAVALRNAAPPPRLSDVVSEVRALATEQIIVDPQLVEAAARAWSANTIHAFLSDIRLWDT
ncbi:hypothetical protein [Novosphingobium sp. G106]|uniref:hypothetical protein n=1 Tax=Novosphingobium sp. G106 TaxID=2849500 RepID=UPI0028116164|nr:hypothetical protein [Novosphingobium sp. G106]